MKRNLGLDWRMAAMASTPLIAGSRRSIKTTSAGVLQASLHASSPELASPTTVMSGCVPTMAAMPKRTTGWSSTTMTRIFCPLVMASAIIYPPADGGRPPQRPRSECESRHELAVPGLRVERRRVDVPPSGRGNSSAIARLRLRGRGERRIGEIGPVENVKELGADLERHLLANGEAAAEAQLFERPPRVAEVAVIGRSRAPSTRGGILPRIGVQHEILVGIDAVAVQVLEV